ncbi:hypothetical protein [Corynebacterium ulcerans]|uniref:hypothetical protein n=1 Tax=Corynebacterium ulcerans TaxID=65058 RepID=UPI0034A20B00
MPQTFTLRPGLLDELAHQAGATSDKQLAAFIGITETELETLRYGAGTPATLIAFAEKAQAHRRAADLLAEAAQPPAA